MVEIGEHRGAVTAGISGMVTFGRGLTVDDAMSMLQRSIVNMFEMVKEDPKLVEGHFGREVQMMQRHVEIT